MSSVLKVENLCKSFGKRRVVNNVSFEVNEGEIFGFLGPNGAGKTTVIKMIMGFLYPDSGSIEVCGYDIKKNYEKAMGMLGGIVEVPEMYGYLSGRTNLEMYARLQGVEKSRVDEVLALVGLSDRAKDKVKKYSLGMKQRIGLAQALIHKPKVLILDEPMNGLDPAGIKDLRDILINLSRETDAAVMVSSHLLGEMQLMCDRVGIINNGDLLDVKPIHELVSEVVGETVYRFSFMPNAEALTLLEGRYTIKNAGEGFVDLAVDEDKVPEVISLLIGGKVAVNGAQRLEVSLEEAYIRVTKGGGQIA